MDERTRIVAAGYDRVADRYEALELAVWPRLRRLRELLARVPEGGAVIDLGCGNGVPALAEIARRHHAVGVDVSAEQVRRAREHVPEAVIVQADMAELAFDPATFDAVVSFYAIEHVPREHHSELVRRIHDWLRPGGRLLFAVEARDGHEAVAEWLGQPMFFSQFGPEETLAFVREAGFEVAGRGGGAARGRKRDRVSVGSRTPSALNSAAVAEVVSTNEFKNGMHIELEGSVWRIVEFQHVKPGKGGAFVRTKVKSIDSGSVVDKTFRAGEKFPRVFTEVKNMQYLYDSGDEVVFMDEATYEQLSLPHATLEAELPYMQPSTPVQLLFVGGKPSGVQLPSSIELAVTDTEPGVKGDTVSNVTKPATLETGAVVQVPLFVNTGDRVKVDPRDGRYISRA
jgi:elongation factor P